MKNHARTVGLFFIALLIAGLLAGCASGGPKGAYPTLRNTQVNVDWPMTRFNNAVARGQVTLGMQQQVNQAYAAYKEGFDAALKAANNNYDAHTPDNVQALANQLLSAVGAVPVN